MQTSGLVLDVYDDCTGEVLRSAFPQPTDIPDSIKVAHALSFEERARLPNDAFALVLSDGGECLRKYACVDEGNTVLSTVYFLMNGHKLPEEAQKVAAKNLVEAAGWFDLSPPEELQKIAFGGAVLKALNLGMGGLAAKGAVEQTAQNLRAVNQGAGGILSPGQMKMGELTGGPLMPLSAPGEANKTRTENKTKLAEIGRLVSVSKGEGHENFGPEEGPPYHGYTPGKQPDAPQSSFGTVVDVTNKKAAAAPSIEKHASRHALKGRYPLDDYGQVKQASAYFDTYCTHFSPEERREYCLNLVPRADELGISVSEQARKYASYAAADSWDAAAAFEARRKLLQDDEKIAVLNSLERRFRQKSWSTPGEKVAGVSAIDAYAHALLMFDKEAGLAEHYDQIIPDPYNTLLKVADDVNWSDVIGNDRITCDDLCRLSNTPTQLRDLFDDDFIAEFKKDPVGIYKSLPLTQKKILMHRAAQSAPGHATY